MVAEKPKEPERMMSNATWKRLEKLATEIGATVELCTESGDLYAYSPQGMTWKDNGGSIMVEPFEQVVAGKTASSWKPEAFGTMLSRISAGVRDDPGYPGWWDDDED